MIYLVALAGGLGALARFGIDLWLGARGPAWRATLIVNLVGSAVLGWATVALPHGWIAVLGTGACGGFTTFSSACWQVAQELRQRHLSWAIGYTTATVLGCLSLAWIGAAMGR